MDFEPSHIPCGVLDMQMCPVHPMWAQSVAGLRAVARCLFSMVGKVTSQQWLGEKEQSRRACFGIRQASLVSGSNSMWLWVSWTSSLAFTSTDSSPVNCR